MRYPNDFVNEIYNEEKYSSTVTTFSKISVFVTVSFIILHKFLFDVFSPWLEVWNGPQKRLNFFPILSKAFQNYVPSGTFSK